MMHSWLLPSMPASTWSNGHARNHIQQAGAGAGTVSGARTRADPSGAHTPARSDPGAPGAQWSIAMSDGRAKKPAPAPDGDPKPRAPDGDSTAKSTVSEVQDPEIAGDSGKEQKRVETNEAVVDEAGQVTRKTEETDLLH